MSTYPVLRSVESEIHHEPLRSDRRYRLKPEFVARLEQAAAEKEGRATAVPRGLPRLVMQFFATIRMWRERAESRRALASCDPRLLQDIGVSPLDAGREIGKPFWRS